MQNATGKLRQEISLDTVQILSVQLGVYPQAGMIALYGVGYVDEEGNFQAVQRQQLNVPGDVLAELQQTVDSERSWNTILEDWIYAQIDKIANAADPDTGDELTA